MFKNNLLLAVSFTFLFLMLNSWTAPVVAQDKDQSSRRETATIKAIETAGGRVYRISAVDTSREISFNLSSKPIGDEQIKDISAIGEVIWLNLAGTKITNDGLKHLSGMPLKKLHLERTQIGDDGLQHLKSFKDLEYLNLYDTKVTDAGIEHLKALKGLKKLYVWKSEITEDGINKLGELLPDAQVVGALKLEPVVIEEPKKEEPKKEEPKKPEAKKDDAKKNAKGKGKNRKGRKGKAAEKKAAGDKAKDESGGEKKSAETDKLN